MSNESYFAEISKSFISETDKLETLIDHLLQKSEKFSIDEIVPTYYLRLFMDMNFTQASYRK